MELPVKARFLSAFLDNLLHLACRLLPPEEIAQKKSKDDPSTS
jgi:hypothetical protein